MQKVQVDVFNQRPLGCTVNLPAMLYCASLFRFFSYEIFRSFLELSGLTCSSYAIWADITGKGGCNFWWRSIRVCEQLVGIHFKINPGPVLVRGQCEMCFSCFSFVVSVFRWVHSILNDFTHTGPAILISTEQSRSKVGHLLPHFFCLGHCPLGSVPLQCQKALFVYTVTVLP